MLKNIVLLGLATSLGACSFTPQVQVSNPGSVMVSNISQFHAAEALQMAQVECQKYGRHAVHVPDNQRDGVASYQCVE